MGLVIPTVSQEPGPQYATEINNDLSIIDAHGHTGEAGDGKQIVSAAINVNDDISFNEHNLEDLRALRFADQNTAVGSPSDVACAYVLEGDLWFNNGSGSAVQITTGTAVDTSSSNTILALQEVAGSIAISALSVNVFFDVDTTAARTITLPLANAVSKGRWFIIADKTGTSAAFPITIQRAGSDSINGATSFTINSAFGSAILVSDGVSAWRVFAIYDTQNGILGIGAAPARSGAIGLSNNLFIKARNTAGTSDIKLLGLSSADAIVLGDTSTSVQVKATQVNITEGSNSALTITPNSSGTTSLGFAQSTTPSISQGTQVSDTATHDLTVAPQGPYASATSTNRAPGSLVVNLSAPTNSGTTEGTLKVARAGTAVLAMGPIPGFSSNGALWAGNVTPSSSNFAIQGDGSTSTQVSVPSSGTIYLSFAGATTSGLNLSSATVLSYIPTVAFDLSVSSPTIKQNARTSDAATSSITITPQAAFASATSGNRSPGSTIISLADPTNSGDQSLNPFLQVQQGGRVMALIGARRDSTASGYGAIWLGNGVNQSTAAEANMCFGSDGAAVSFLNSPAGGTLYLTIGLGACLAQVMTPSQNQIGIPTWTWGSGITPTINHADNTTASATGTGFSITAQNATGTTSIGGDLLLSSGSGTSSAGKIRLKSAGTTVLIVGSNTLSFNQGTSAPAFGQIDQTANSTNGQKLIIASQNATGTTSTGGDLQINSGTGTTTAGKLTLLAGATVRFTANATGIAFYAGTPVAQASRVGQLTDSTAGTPGTTLAAVTGTTYSTDVPTIRNWMASMAAKLNAVELAIHNISLTT